MLAEPDYHPSRNELLLWETGRSPLAPASVNPDWGKACREWFCVSIRYNEVPGNCACSHSIRWRCTIQNVHTGQYRIVGTDCVEKFIGIMEAEVIRNNIEDIRAGGRKLREETIEYAHKRGWIMATITEGPFGEEYWTTDADPFTVLDHFFPPTDTELWQREAGGRRQRARAKLRQYQQRFDEFRRKLAEAVTQVRRETWGTQEHQQAFINRIYTNKNGTMGVRIAESTYIIWERPEGGWKIGKSNYGSVSWRYPVYSRNGALSTLYHLSKSA
jgi:hypothetical protein